MMVISKSELSNYFLVKLIFIFVFTVILAGGSYKHVDRITTFSIQGRIVDKNTDLPIKDADVFFIDSGYDYNRSKLKQPIAIGKSDNLGNVDISFEYLWGVNQVPNEPTPVRSFTIEIIKEGYNGKSVNFFERKLSKKNGIINVPIGKFVLTKSHGYHPKSQKKTEIPDSKEIMPW